MKKVDRDTPEYAQEWANCAQLTEALKLAPYDTNLKAALMESAEKLGIIVPIDAADPRTR
jgi:hypothetical protein